MMNGAVPALALAAKKLLAEFTKNNATCEENAVSLQEIYDNWQVRAPRLLRMLAIKSRTRFLCRKKKLLKTEDGKYYLNTEK